MPASDRKQNYFVRLIKLLDDHKKIFLVNADNVGSNHMGRIRVALRALGAHLLMGKNTMIRKAIRGHLDNNPDLEELLPFVKGNIGFVFFNGDDAPIRQLLEDNRVSAAAKAGSYAPNDVTIPAGLTGLEPTMTGFLQALNIQSKITKGQIELTNDVNIVLQGQRVGASEATLLGKLGIKPFRYGLLPTGLFQDGSVISAQYLNIGEGNVVSIFQSVVSNITALSLALEFPTYVAVPQYIVKGYKNVLAFGLASEFKFKQIDDFANRAASAPAPTAAPVSGPQPTAPKEEVKKEEPQDESEPEMMDLFG